MKIPTSRVKIILRNLSILIAPFLIMISINEIVRPSIKENHYLSHNVTAINSVYKIKDRCTWICHNQTIYCKEHHVKFLTNYFYITDKLYFGLIAFLKSTGNYGLANIIILALLLPFLIWILIIKSLNIQDKINYHKRLKNDY